MPRAKRTTPPEPKPGYGFNDVVTLTGATKSNLIHWTSKKIVQADVEETAGRGHHRRFSAFNVVEVSLAVTLNHFRLPVQEIRAAVGALGSFHHGAVALHDEIEKAPLSASRTCPTGQWSPGRFKSVEQRRQVAQSFADQNWWSEVKADPELRKRITATGDSVAYTEDEQARVAQRVRGLAQVWARIRTGPLARGVPEQSWSPFLGLFLGGYEAGAFRYGVVALDPPNLKAVIEETALVVDLADIVFRVGERCARVGIVLGEL